MNTEIKIIFSSLNNYLGLKPDRCECIIIRWLKPTASDNLTTGYKMKVLCNKCLGKVEKV